MVSNSMWIKTLLYHLFKEYNCLLCKPMLWIATDHSVPCDNIPAHHIFKYVQGIINCPTFGIHGNESIINVEVRMKTHLNYLTMSTSPMEALRRLVYVKQFGLESEPLICWKSFKHTSRLHS